ncbi:hypothetical protein I4U23_018074 [Adineta vaga]|nr:hypothetical protein I4U23_018074 [Adineta vaga]
MIERFIIEPTRTVKQPSKFRNSILNNCSQSCRKTCYCATCIVFIICAIFITLYFFIEYNAISIKNNSNVSISTTPSMNSSQIPLTSKTSSLVISNLTLYTTSNINTSTASIMPITSKRTTRTTISTNTQTTTTTTPSTTAISSTTTRPSTTTSSTTTTPSTIISSTIPSTTTTPSTTPFLVPLLRLLPLRPLPLPLLVLSFLVVPFLVLLLRLLPLRPLPLPLLVLSFLVPFLTTTSFITTTSTSRLCPSILSNPTETITVFSLDNSTRDLLNYTHYVFEFRTPNQVTTALLLFEFDSKHQSWYLDDISVKRNDQLDHELIKNGNFENGIFNLIWQYCYLSQPFLTAHITSQYCRSGRYCFQSRTFDDHHSDYLTQQFNVQSNMQYTIHFYTFCKGETERFNVSISFQ